MTKRRKPAKKKVTKTKKYTKKTPVKRKTPTKRKTSSRKTKTVDSDVTMSNNTPQPMVSYQPSKEDIIRSLVLLYPNLYRINGTQMYTNSQQGWKPTTNVPPEHMNKAKSYITFKMKR
jgi:hypothetical protein